MADGRLRMVPERLRILKYPWHTAHDYELAKLPHEFLYLSGTGRVWATAHRPMPENVTSVSSLGERRSDLMILHLDQWSWHETSKRFLFLRLRDRYRGPRVVIIHGCNLVDGCASERMRELTDGCHVVVNSETAKRCWEIPGATFIRHGMSPEEWPATDYRLNNVVMVQSAYPRHALVRNQEGIERASRKVPLTWIGRDVVFGSFSEYREFLARSSVFFNPSFASSNPRARTEAMLCGLAVVTTAMHGESEYIDNGVNGYCSNEIDELVDFMLFLRAHPRRAREIGEAGRATARRLFTIERFVAEWQRLLCSVINTATSGDRR